MMHPKGKSWLHLAVMLAGMIGSLVAGQFVPPTQGPVPFRTDKIPLNVETIHRLARNLEEMARGIDGTAVPTLRRAAQLLALSLALKPESPSARDLLNEFLEGRHQTNPNDQRAERHVEFIQRLIEWLQSPAAGNDAQALAACLRDVITPVSRNPQDAPHEQGQWNGWIAAVSAYQSKPPVFEVKPETPLDDHRPTRSTNLLEQAEILTPMWRPAQDNNGNTIWTQSPAPLRMTATRMPDDDNGKLKLNIIIGPNGDSSDEGEFSGNPMERPLSHLAKLLRNQIIDQYGNLTRGVRIEINSPDFERSLESGHQQTISAACAVLASAAFSGQEPDAIIIGKVDNRGNYSLPSRFWFQLKDLGKIKDKNRRLILPASSKEYLDSILAMEYPDFFLQYEVLLAADLKQLTELSAKSPAEPLASATARFKEIQDRSKNQDLRNYLDNSFVKQRLAALLKDMPTHVSAKMLLTQASGNRPYQVGRKVLAAELLDAIEPMAWLLNSNEFVFDESLEFPPAPQNIPRVGETYETCRTNVDRLERYTNKNDRDLLEEVRKMTVLLRTLDRAPKTRGKSNRFLMHAVKAAYTEWREQYRTWKTKLEEAAKD